MGNVLAPLDLTAEGLARNALRTPLKKLKTRVPFRFPSGGSDSASELLLCTQVPRDDFPSRYPRIRRARIPGIRRAVLCWGRFVIHEGGRGHKV